ncbi:hypothetical protein DH2020_002739 [Rehmannia glutinosa]|uniref:C2 domain-containing protein n=1 Tax=Rehmannia glutinosa TaxID=99300 RepID=A0ABR0XV07_REHGL
MANQNRNQNKNPNSNGNTTPHEEDFNLTETRPSLGGGRISGNDRFGTAFDLVEQMNYLYVRVLKAKELPGSPDPFVEIKLGGFKAATRNFEKTSVPEWNQVFSVLKDRIQAPVIEISVKDKAKSGNNGLIGIIVVDAIDVPRRVPPDSPLAPEWSKVYLSPRLWYLRVNVIEAQELQLGDKNRQQPEILVRATLGNMILRTKISQSKNVNPLWNEDLMFTVAEPFEEQLVLCVEEKIGNTNKKDELGQCVISLQGVEKRMDFKPPISRWYNLQKHTVSENGQRNVSGLNSRVHLRISLDGGYHVLDELTHYSSDLRATARQLWKPSIGVLELGILNAQNLTAMKTKDGRGFTDAYCVAKVFDNCQLQGGKGAGKDSRIGKVRIRLSTLETNRVYTHLYPLIVLSPSGVKKMGEIQLAVRFSCASLLNMLTMYCQPLLPNIHYLHPLSCHQIEILRHQATQIVSTRLSRAEPPLRKEVVEYMLDVGRTCGVMLLSTVFLYLFLIGTWNYRLRPRHPPHMDVRLSQADTAQNDELDEEFDTFPTSQKQINVVKMRYDRLRAIGSRVQTVLGDLATQGERFYNLLTWRDPRATALFLIFCLIASVVLYITPPNVVVIVMGFYAMRHPRFRDRLPSPPMNFLRRLPAKTDSLL